MGRPDPNGCGACGLATCELHLLLAEVGSTGEMPEQAALDAAREVCNGRDAVDWQAERRGRTPPPEVLAAAAELRPRRGGDRERASNVGVIAGHKGRP